MEQMSFEDAVVRIEQITALLSDEQLQLQEALEMFKEAASLIVFCKKELNDAELVVEEYKKNLISEDH